MKASERHRFDQLLIDGTPRHQLVILAARAIVDACDDVVLWTMIHRARFEDFRAIARKQFQRHEPGLRFTDTELSWIYWHIARHVAQLADAAHQPVDAPPPLPPTPRDPTAGPITIDTDTSPTVH